MPLYDYKCECGREKEINKPIGDFKRLETCSCGGAMSRVFNPINITGTRDNFGVRKAFYDPKTRQTIDTHRKWEKAGFRPAGEIPDRRDSDHQAKVKEKTKRALSKQGRGTVYA